MLCESVTKKRRGTSTLCTTNKGEIPHTQLSLSLSLSFSDVVLCDVSCARVVLNIVIKMKSCFAFFLCVRTLF